MKLTGEAVERLYGALLDAFNRASLESMLRSELGWRLDQIMSPNLTMNLTVSNLITFADNRGQIDELLWSATAYNPTNKLLKDFAESYESSRTAMEKKTADDTQMLDSAAKRIRDAIIKKSRQLDLSNLGLSELPGDIIRIDHLEELDVSGNSLKSIPEYIEQLSDLHLLNLNGNLLTDLPEGFKQLDNLVSLDLSRNQYVELPHELFSHPRLRDLNLSRNKITSLPDSINVLTELESLNLADNRLSSLPSAMAGLSNLKVLAIGGNNLGQFPIGISKIPTLRELNLSNNSLETIPNDIAQLSDLSELDVRNNQLREIPSGVISLLSLTSLNLANNLIATIPFQITQMQHLSFINLSGNPFDSLPEIFSNVTDPSNLFSLLEERISSSERPLHEAKLLVVGEAEVGKTSLANRLQGKPFSQSEDSTRGVEISTWDEITLGNTPIRLNIWDFGGQTINHATHLFFLTERSVYVLVIDSRRGAQESRLEYWLKIIRSFGGVSPIIVVCNKADQNRIDLNWTGLKNKYGVYGFVEYVSCVDNEGIDQVKELITSAVGDLKHIADPVPKGWFDVKDALEMLSSPYISFKQYQELATQYGVINAANQKNLLTFLNDLGTVLWFGDDPRLSDTNVLDPEWVTQAVYYILNSDTLFLQHGTLTLRQIAEELTPRDYQEDRIPYIIDVMKRFELCIELPDAGEEKLLVPDLLPRDEPDVGDWSDGLEIQFEYDILPTSIISRFIVRMFRFVEGENYWRTGVILAKENSRALITADLTDRRLLIHVIGPAGEIRRFLEVIRTELRIIHSDVPDIDPVEIVPVPGTTSSIEYETLLHHEQLGVEEAVILGHNEPVPVRKLLEGIDPPEKRSTPAVDRLREFEDPVPTTIRQLLNRLTGILVNLPVAFDFLSRSTLLVGIPHTDGLNRSSVNVRVDITYIVEQLWDQPRQFSAQHPLAIIIDNALPYAGDDRTTRGQQLKALKSELAEAYRSS